MPRRDLLPRASSVPRVEVTRIGEGLWRWSVPRDGVELASAYLEHGDAMLLVDPVLPPPGDDLARFERAIARDLARLGGRAWVLLTRSDDPRDAEATAAMTGASRWQPDEPREPAEPSQPIPPGIEAISVGAGQVALWSPVHRALMPGRAMEVRDGALQAAPGVDAAPLLALGAEVVIPSAGPMLP